MIKGIVEVAEYNIDEAIKLRGTIYSFLSRGYKREVDEVFLKSIENMLPVFEKLSVGLEDEYIRNVSRNFKKFIETISNKSKLIEDLDRQYVTLFLGLGIDESVVYSSPYESVYMSLEGQVMEEQCDAVMEIYAAFGVGLSSDFKEHEDHISAELSFMCRLCDSVVDYMSRDDVFGALEKLKVQKQFMDQHLLNWVPMFCSDLRKAAKDGFYQCLADLTMVYLCIDVQFLEALIEVIEADLNKC